MQMLGDNLAFDNPDHTCALAIPRGAKRLAHDFRRLHRISPNRFNHLSHCKGLICQQDSTRPDSLNITSLKALNSNDIRALSRRYLSTVLQAKSLRRRQARRPIDRPRRTTTLNQTPDHIVQMPFFRDIKRVPIIGTQTHIGRGKIVEQFRQRLQVFADRAFSNEHPQPFL